MDLLIDNAPLHKQVQLDILIHVYTVSVTRNKHPAATWCHHYPFLCEIGAVFSDVRIHVVCRMI